MSETETAAAAPALATPGAVLTAARRAQNLEIADVARQLKLSASQVVALESDAHDQLPGPVFVRGFIRNYARLLKVDVESLLPAAESAAPAGEMVSASGSDEVPFPSAPARSWHSIAVGGAVVVLVALGLYEFGFNDPSPQPVTVVTPPRPDAQVVEAQQPVPVPVPQTAGEAPTAVATAAAPAAAVTVPAAPISAAPAPTAPAAASAPSAPASSLPPYRDASRKSAEARVHMVFTASSWVEIRDRAGQVVYSQMNLAGSEQRVAAEPPLSVVIGNARGLRLMHNDKPVDLGPHTKADVARLTLE